VRRIAFQIRRGKLKEWIKGEANTSITITLQIRRGKEGGRKI